MGDTKTKGEKWLAVGTFAPKGVLVRYEHSDTWLDFKAYEVVATDAAGEVHYFELEGGKGGMDQTDDPEKAAGLGGFVKWDGCAEFYFKQEHFCGRHDVDDYCAMLKELHALCLLLPSVDRDCADYPAVSNRGSDGT